MNTQPEEVTDNSRVSIYKDKAGQWWFFGIYSNNFEDKEGEIFAWEGHEEYAKWVRQSGVKLPITVLHQPKYPSEIHLAQLIGLNSGLFDAKEFSDNYLKLYKPFAIAQTEMVIPLNGFMFVVGKVLEEKQDVIESWVQSGLTWGMSHGFIPLETDGNIINKYRTFELTVLPPALAANAITLFDVRENKKMKEYLKGLSKEDEEKLVELLGVDPGELETAAQEAQELLTKVISSKELETDEEEEKETEEVEETEDKSYEGIRGKLFSDLDVEGLHANLKQVVERFEKIDARLQEFETRLTSTEKSEDEKIAGSLFKPNWDMWGETKGVEDESLVEALKADALGDKAVVDEAKKGADNPLAMAFWQPMMGQK